MAALLCFGLGCSDAQEEGTASAALNGATRLKSTTLEMASATKADKEAHQKQLIVQAINEVDPNALKQHQATYLARENVMNAGLWNGWEGLPSREPGVTYLIDQPILLASLDLDIELRRRLGANNHTVVVGLNDDAGCAGDIVQERLVYRFGAATQIVARAGLGTQAHPTVDILNRFALQVACLSDRQLAELEEAMSLGFELVAQRLGYQGLQSLTPAFARVMAPRTCLAGLPA